MFTITNVFGDFSHAFEMTKSAMMSFRRSVATEKSQDYFKCISTLYKTKKMPVVRQLTFWQIMSD